jgi:hypothetical protein
MWSSVEQHAPQSVPYGRPEAGLEGLGDELRVVVLLDLHPELRGEQI